MIETRHIAVLDAVADSTRWNDALSRLPEVFQDIYFSAEYAAMNCMDAETRATMFCFSDGVSVWLYPFLLRPILRVGDQLVGGDWFDIETPYGYGGPLCNVDDATFLTQAHAAFTSWCRQQRVIAEFVRFHPILHNDRWADPRVEVVPDRKTVSLQLSQNILQTISKEARHAIRRAAQEGVIVRFFSSGESYGRFVGMYIETMRRVKASSEYHFNAQYFLRLEKLIQQSGWIAVAQKADEVLAVSIFLRGRKFFHYHLSASGPVRDIPGVGNMLIYAGALRARKESLDELHLGGGTTASPDDSLFKFKRSMSNDTHEFHIGKRVHDAEAYGRLRSLWKDCYPSLESVYGQRLLCYRYKTA